MGPTSFGIGVTFMFVGVTAGGLILCLLLGLALLFRFSSKGKDSAEWSSYFIAASLLFVLDVAVTCFLLLGAGDMLSAFLAGGGEFVVSLALVLVDLVLALFLAANLSSRGVVLSRGIGHWSLPVLMVLAAAAFMAMGGGHPDRMLGLWLPVAGVAALAVVLALVNRFAGSRGTYTMPVLAGSILALWLGVVFASNSARRELALDRLQAIEAVMPCADPTQLLLVGRFAKAGRDLISPASYYLPFTLDLEKGRTWRALSEKHIYDLSWNGSAAHVSELSPISVIGGASKRSGFIDYESPAFRAFPRDATCSVGAVWQGYLVREEPMGSINASRLTFWAHGGDRVSLGTPDIGVGFYRLLDHYHGIVAQPFESSSEPCFAYVFRPATRSLVRVSCPDPRGQALAASEDGLVRGGADSSAAESSIAASQPNLGAGAASPRPLARSRGLVLLFKTRVDGAEKERYRIQTMREGQPAPVTISEYDAEALAQAWLVGPSADVAVLVRSTGGAVLDLHDNAGKLLSSMPVSGIDPGVEPEPVYQRNSPYRGYLSKLSQKLLLYDSRSRRFRIESIPSGEGPRASLVGEELYFADGTRVVRRHLRTGVEMQVFGAR